MQRHHRYKIAVSNYSKNTSKSKSSKGDNSKFTPIDLLIIHNQLTEFEASSCNTFQDIMVTNFQSQNLQREII